MDAALLAEYLDSYGIIIVFIIVFLEYLNLPGLPSGIIMPMAGVWASKGEVGFITVVILTLIAGLLGSWVLYFIGRIGGEYLLKKYLAKFPKQEKIIDKNFRFLREKGSIGVFVGKLIPMARTLISIPAGVLKINFLSFTISSALGILFWNTAFISAGYFIGESIFNKF